MEQLQNQTLSFQQGFMSSVSGWLGVVKPDDDEPPKEKEPVAEPSDSNAVAEKEDSKQINDQPADGATLSETPENGGEQPKTNIAEESTEPENKVDSGENMQQQIDEMSAKAVTAAKEWGTWLYGVGKVASEEVVKSAKTLKDTVEEKTIIGQFHKEQEKYISENKEKKSKSEAAVPPWVGYNEEEAMKKQIMALSQDRRNFLRNPPSGVQFHFEYESMFPIAMATLHEDKDLEKMRFDLVPKQVKEEMFWRNYFYRVSLIKQSAQLTSLAQQTGASNESDKKSQAAKSESAVSPQVKKQSSEHESEILTSSSPPDNEFVSDTFQADQFNEEDLKKEMQMLGMSNKDGAQDKKKKNKDIPEWEKELQAELQEYEVVNDGDDDNDIDSADLEQEILQQIEEESKQTS